MEIGIVGLTSSGKTSLFNALTKGKAETAGRGFAGLAPNIGVAKVPDERLLKLSAMFKPQKTTPAEIKYTDVAAAPTGEKKEGWTGQLLAYLAVEDALVAVARAFKGENVPHPHGSIDPVRDLATIEMELAFSDLAIMERRLEKLTTSLKAAKATEREAHQKEQVLLGRIKASLEKEIPIREQGLSADEQKMLEGYKFLSQKPLLAVFNIGEDDLPKASALEAEWQSKIHKPEFRLVAVCARLEAELSQLGDEEARTFRAEMGAAESALDRLVRTSYELLGLITFFTVGPDECKAWTIRRGTPAQRAAGKVHSDIERGFIRAEVVTYEDLVKTGGLAEARKQGLLRSEGKTYEVKDGDVINYLFNV
ncbi:MAG: redox-regulated ATPase YchF [Chloroflexi bacterium]|nr:redox-regulated ATPase YchF [Chloroflexota bacterium]